jgi:hypothetical protein
MKIVYKSSSSIAASWNNIIIPMQLQFAIDDNTQRLDISFFEDIISYPYPGPKKDIISQSFSDPAISSDSDSDSD